MGRGKVGVGDQARRAGAGDHARAAHEQRDPDVRLPGLGLVLGLTMLAEMDAVVAREDQERAVQPPGVPQGLVDRQPQLVDGLKLLERGGPRFIEGLNLGGRQQRQAQRHWLVDDVGLVERHIAGHLPAREHAAMASRRLVRQVWRHRRQDEQQWLAERGAADQVDGLVLHPGVGDSRRGRARSVDDHRLVLQHAARLKGAPDGPAGWRVAAIVAVDVLAEVGRKIAGGLHRHGEHRGLMRLDQPAAGLVRDHPVIVREPAGQQAGRGRPADRRLHKGAQARRSREDHPGQPRHRCHLRRAHIVG